MKDSKEFEIATRRIIDVHQEKIGKLNSLEDTLSDYKIYEMVGADNSTCSCRNCVESGGYLPCGFNVKYIATYKHLPDVWSLSVYKSDAYCNLSEECNNDFEFEEGEMFAANILEDLIELIIE